MLEITSDTSTATEKTNISNRLTLRELKTKQEEILKRLRTSPTVIQKLYIFYLMKEYIVKRESLNSSCLPCFRLKPFKSSKKNKKSNKKIKKSQKSYRKVKKSVKSIKKRNIKH
jgi:hypothetical protein